MGKELHRREFLKGAVSIAATLTLGKAEAAEVPRRSFTELGKVRTRPLSGDGITRLLDGVGLNRPSGISVFKDLNARILDNTEALRLSQEYVLPLQALPITTNYLALLESRKVPARFLDEVHAFNRLHNPNYRIQNPNAVRPGQMVWIPDWNTGFYDTPEERALEAREVMSGIPYPKLKTALEQEKNRGQKLRGIALILDPGHGGEDPGARPIALDGMKQEVTVSEAVVVHDVSLRLMRLAMREQAEVFLTHFSKTMGILDERGRFPTWVPNDTYNIGRGGNPDISIDDQDRSLRTRELIAGGLVRGRKLNLKKTAFVSIHMNSLPPDMDPNKEVYTHRTDTDTLFANAFAKNMGARRRLKGLGVLRGNPVTNNCLVELLNMANSRRSWILRDPSQRERLAKELMDGLVSTARQGIL
ncbi:MAG TPA: N-acetylmuramoyl-L-alanine amidase [Candidatus Paceibacterota bacterium]